MIVQWIFHLASVVLSIVTNACDWSQALEADSKLCTGFFSTVWTAVRWATPWGRWGDKWRHGCGRGAEEDTDPVSPFSFSPESMLEDM